MAYPLFALAAFRGQLSALPAPARGAVAAEREEAGTMGASVQETITELAGLLSPSNLVDFSDAAVQVFAKVMRSEVCLLLTNPEKSGEFSIVTGYDLVHGKSIPGVALDAGRCPTISEALTQRQSIVLSPQLHSADLTTLKEILGLEGVGPAILAAVATHELAYGGLLLLSPYARRHWPREDLQTVTAAASHLATRIAEILRNEVGVPKMPGTSRALEEARQRIQELEASNARLEQEVSVGGLRPQPETSPDLAALLARYGEAQETIRRLEEQIQAFKTSPSEMIAAERSPEEERLATQLQLTLQELAEARARLQFAQEEQAEAPQAPQVSGLDIKSIGLIAQDLRRPLASVMGYTNLLLGESIGLLGTMQRRFLERVRDSIDRMAILLNKLIETAALDVEGFGLASGPANLDSCIEEAITQASSALRQKDLALRLDLPEEVPHVMGESDSIIQILVHLINNAIGASPQGAEVVIAGRVQETDSAGFLILSISDSGAGIPAEELGHVFQRAYRDDVPPIEGLGDSGVGLSVVKALAESLGGRVWVDSEVGIGSTFTVLLPLADHHLPQMSEEIEVA
jgi:signal transduction histidine kinase